jgi:hypothetical protein
MIEDLNKHLTDQEFFTYVKFFDLVISKKNLVNEDTNEISVYQFSIGEDESYRRFRRLFNFLKYQDLPVKISESRYNKLDEMISSYANGKDAKEAGKPNKEDLDDIAEKIKSSKPIKFSETGMLSWAWFEVYDSTHFLPHQYEISDEIKSEVKKNIDTYLENLINGKLSISKNNYYKFGILKEAFIQTIEKKGVLKLFGKNFVIKEELNNEGNLKSDPNFCIIQTAYALHHLGYLTVNNIWRDDEYKEQYSSSSNIRYFISINVTIEDSFVSEINARYKKENPKNVIEGYNKERGVLKFAGAEINLSLKGKETDASLLMNTLYKRDDMEWVYNDEIFQDWHFIDIDIKQAPKNKIYFAAKKINEKVAMKTTIEDFIEFTTEKVRINPRYNKINE